jgi:oligopeptidase A
MRLTTKAHRIVSLWIALQTGAKFASAFSTTTTTATTTAAAAASTRAALIRMASSATSVDASATATNPFLQQEGLPKFESLEPKNLGPAVEELLTKLEDDFSKLEESLDSSSSYEDVLPVIEQMQFPLGYVWGVAGHLNGVKNGDELREAYESNQPKVVESMTRFSQSKPLYDALSGIQSQWEEEKMSDDDFLDKQKRRAVENSLMGMKLGGVGLEGAEKERFNEIKQKLAKLSTTFSNNVLDETKAFSHVVTDASIMEGVPESAKALWANSYLSSQTTEGDDEPPSLEEASKSGPWKITLDIPSYLPVMSHLPDRGIRELLYKAYVQKAGEASGDPEKNNVPLIYEILTLKQEMAKMLGFANYAELSLAKKMAPGVADVTELTDLMASKAVPAALKELEAVTALARTEGGDEYSEESLPKLEPWDVTFWVSRNNDRKTKFPFSRCRAV